MSSFSPCNSMCLKAFLFSLLPPVTPKETWLLQICLLSLHIFFKTKPSSEYLAFSSRVWQAQIICNILPGVFQVCRFSHNFPLSRNIWWTISGFSTCTLQFYQPHQLSVEWFFPLYISLCVCFAFNFFALLLVNNEFSLYYSINTSLVSTTWFLPLNQQLSHYPMQHLFPYIKVNILACHDRCLTITWLLPSLATSQRK